MFKNSKYSKFLTIVLIVVVVIIVVLLGFLVFDFMKNMFLQNDAEDAVSEFEGGRTNRITNTTVTNTTQENIDITPPAIGNTTPNTSTGGSSNSSSKTYKGFPWVGNIEIPRTNIKYPVLADTSPKAIEVAVAILDGVGLNQIGNTTIVGHNYRNGLFFSNNSKIQEGDKIYITDFLTNQKVEYTVYRKYTTSDSDGSYMRRDTQGKREISLSTCTNDVKKRLVIWAKAD